MVVIAFDAYTTTRQPVKTGAERLTSNAFGLLYATLHMMITLQKTASCVIAITLMEYLYRACEYWKL